MPETVHTVADIFAEIEKQEKKEALRFVRDTLTVVWGWLSVDQLQISMDEWRQVLDSLDKRLAEENTSLNTLRGSDVPIETASRSIRRLIKGLKPN